VEKKVTGTDRKKRGENGKTRGVRSGYAGRSPKGGAGSVFGPGEGLGSTETWLCLLTGGRLEGKETTTSDQSEGEGSVGVWGLLY